MIKHLILAAILLISPLASASLAPPPAQAATCSDYIVQALAQLALQSDPSDPSDLDGDDDNGIACDHLPCPCNHEPVEEAIGDQADEPPATVQAATATPTNTAVPDSTPLQMTPSVPPTPTPVASAPASGVITPPATGSGGLLHGR